MKTEELIRELETMAEEFVGCVAGEKLSGNVVKEALYRGTAVGLRMAINEISRRGADTDPGDENLIVDGQTSQIKALKPETLSD